MPTFLVTISPGTPAIPVIGTDETDAVAGALQSLDSLREIIALCADTVPEMAAVCERAAPRASAAQPWPEAAAVRAVVAWWMGRHPEIAVRPKMHPALQPLADAGTALGAVITAQTARIAPLSTCTWGTPHLPSGGIDAGERMPVETCSDLSGRANEALPPAYSATGPNLPVCSAMGADCVSA